MDKEQYIRDITESVDRNFVGILETLGGRKFSRKMGARYGVDDTISEDIQIEIRAAIEQELRAELEQEAILAASGEMKAVAVRWRQDEDNSECIELLKSILNASHPDSVFIVSPSCLTVLQSEVGDVFTRLKMEEEKFESSSFKHVGFCENRKVFVNVYASSMAPNLLCEPGWLKYTDPNLIGGEIIDPNTFEKLTAFATGFTAKVDSTKIKYVMLDIPYMGFI